MSMVCLFVFNQDLKAAMQNSHPGADSISSFQNTHIGYKLKRPAWCCARAPRHIESPKLLHFAAVWQKAVGQGWEKPLLCTNPSMLQQGLQT